MKSSKILGSIVAGIVALSASSAGAKDIWPPPAKYDHGPLMNAAFPSPIISYVSPAKLIAECQGKHLACSYAEIGSPCLIFLPRVGWQPMLRHEMGHCRGWSADHRS